MDLGLNGKVAMITGGSHGLGKQAADSLAREGCKVSICARGVEQLEATVAEFHAHCHRVFDLKPKTVLKVLNKTDAFRRPERFEQFITACEADARGRKGLENRPYPQATYLRGARQAAADVATSDIVKDGMSGSDIGKAANGCTSTS